MPEWLYESGPNGLWVFVLVTVVLGGMAAWATGKAIAETWRPFWQVPVYALLLGAGVRFLHYALFEEPFLAPGNYVIDTVVLLGLALLGHTWARKRMISRQYPWLQMGDTTTGNVLRE